MALLDKSLPCWIREHPAATGERQARSDEDARSGKYVPDDGDSISLVDASVLLIVIQTQAPTSIRGILLTSQPLVALAGVVARSVYAVVCEPEGGPGGAAMRQMGATDAGRFADH